MVATIERLRDHGLDLSSADLERAVRLAVVERRARLAAAPRNELTPAEAEVLEAGGFDLGDRRRGDDDPVLRTITAYAALIGAALTTGVATSRVRQRLGEHSLYGIMPDGDWLLPEFQFDGARVLPGLAQVVKALEPGLHPLSVDSFFTSPEPELSDPVTAIALSPRDWLRAGHPAEPVARLAAQI